MNIFHTIDSNQQQQKWLSNNDDDEWKRWNSWNEKKLENFNKKKTYSKSDFLLLHFSITMKNEMKWNFQSLKIKQTKASNQIQNKIERIEIKSTGKQDIQPSILNIFHHQIIWFWFHIIIITRSVKKFFNSMAMVIWIFHCPVDNDCYHHINFNERIWWWSPSSSYSFWFVFSFFPFFFRKFKIQIYHDYSMKKGKVVVKK